MEKELAEVKRLLEEQKTLVAKVEKEHQELEGEFGPAIKETFLNALNQVALLNPGVDLSCAAYNYIVKDGALHSFNAATKEWEPIYVPIMSGSDGEETGLFQQSMLDKGIVVPTDPEAVHPQDARVTPMLEGGPRRNAPAFFGARGKVVICNEFFFEQRTIVVRLVF